MYRYTTFFFPSKSLVFLSLWESQYANRIKSNQIKSNQIKSGPVNFSENSYYTVTSGMLYLQYKITQNLREVFKSYESFKLTLYYYTCINKKKQHKLLNIQETVWIDYIDYTKSYTGRCTEQEILNM